MSDGMRRSRSGTGRWAVAAGLLAGYLLDRRLGDPHHHHPVAGFGRAAGLLESVVYADRRVAGVVFAATAVCAPVLAGLAATRLTRRNPVGAALLTMAATWTVLGGRTLGSEAAAVAAELQHGELPAARRQVARLVGRDTDALDESEVARAAVESVAENSSDAVVAPLLFGAVAGVPGLLGYRALNTLDAMVGHRSARYERFGWASAKLDDLANWIPARVSAGLAIALAPLVGGSAAGGLAALGDAEAHPSPNAGQVEAAFAGVLGVRLGGRNTYQGVVSERGQLGTGRAPRGEDIHRAVRLAALVGHGAVSIAVLIRLTRPLR